MLRFLASAGMWYQSTQLVQTTYKYVKMMSATALTTTWLVLHLRFKLIISYCVRLGFDPGSGTIDDLT